MMENLLGGLAFAVVLFAHVAALVAVRAQREAQPSDAFEGIRRDPLARVIWNSAG